MNASKRRPGAGLNPTASGLGHPLVRHVIGGVVAQTVNETLYRTLARKHLSPAALGTTSLDRLRKTDIDGLIVKLRKQGLSDSTVRQVYTVLRAALDDAVLDALIARNPCHLVRRPSVEHREAKHLDAATVSAILQAALGLRYHPVLVLVAATGLRRGEALGLRWQQINLKDGTLKVAATLGRVGDELVITEPKSPRSRRTVPLSPAIVSLLKAHKAAQAAERLHAGNQFGGDPSVCGSRPGAAGQDHRQVCQPSRDASEHDGR